MSKLREHSKVVNVTKTSILAIQRFADAFNAATDEDKVSFRIQRLDDLFERYMTASVDLELLTDDDDKVATQNITKDRTDVEEQYFTLRDFLVSKKPFVPVPGNQVPTAPVQSVVRLPQIELPMFDGELDNWIPFRDAFKSLIHNNNSLSAVDKFHYLNSVLDPRVKRLYDSTKVTAANYKITWDLLVERFDQKRFLIKNHISALFNVEAIAKESADAILNLIDQFDRHVRILKTLGELTDKWSPLLVHMVCTRLDQSTLRAWEVSTKETVDEIPAYQDLVEFLHEQARVLQSLKSATVSPSPAAPKEKSRFSVAHAATKPATNIPGCPVCSKSHRIYECDQFRRMTVEQRQEVVRNKKLCWNCLSSAHFSRNCTSRACRCGEKHHSLLHPSPSNGQSSQPRYTAVPHNTPKGSSSSFQPHATRDTPSSPTNTSPPHAPTTLKVEAASPESPRATALSASQGSKAQQTTVLLSTAVVKVHGPSGKSTLARALLDSCSEMNFITERIVQLLGLNRAKQVTTICGMGGVKTQSTHSTVAMFSSLNSSFSETLTFTILPKISNSIPARPVDTSRWNLSSQLVLADPGFATPQKIDMVIGAQLFYVLLQAGQMFVGDGPGRYPMLQQTVLGWVVSGPVVQEGMKSETSSTAMVCTADDLDQRLAKFWEVETCYSPSCLSKEELTCERFFAVTTTRDESGRFIVRLPKKQLALSQLGDSKSSALCRLRWMQRRLEKNPHLKEQYVDFMQEYLDLEHMVPVDAPQDNTQEPPFYLPHHAVVKPSSSTTKCRVVFDGSSKSSTGISLNDCLMVGPTVQDTLYSIVLRFRMQEVALVADITKMYRQIWVHPDDRRLQRIFWQQPTDPEVREYELTTVTYGTASAPYLATRCLKQLSYDHSESANDAAAKIGRDFYVDDLLSGAPTIDEAVQVRGEVQNILGSAGFELRKWASNSAEVLRQIPPELQDERSLLEIDSPSDTTVKTLGLLWHPESDTFRFKVPEFSLDGPVTKRVAASEMAKLFDPTGIVGPVVVKAKVFIQGLWRKGYSWDAPLPDRRAAEWQTFRDDLAALKTISVPRLTKAPGAGDQVELQGYCDASNDAYGACIYIKSKGADGKISVNLLTSKSRVAHILPMPIQRLELCSALLLAHLYCQVVESLGLQNITTYLWTDSMVTLHRLRDTPANYDTFERNRIAEIQRLTDGCIWGHIAGKDNPADIISRGVSPSELIEMPLWWYSPPETEESPTMFVMHAVHDEEDAPAVAAAVTSPPEADEEENERYWLFKRYSTLTTLLRTAAYCRRFATLCRLKRSGTPTTLPSYLTSDELSQSLIGLVKVVQDQSFPKESTLIRAGRLAQLKKSWRFLDPFDDEGALRVGGRLDNSAYAFGRKHPLILPADHPLTELVLEETHQQLLHAGPRLMIAHIRERFWPFNLRNLARKKFRTCLQCFKVQPQLESQLMGQLPKVRITPARPFLNTGVDFCGPVWIKQSTRRGRAIPPVRAYIALFVCMATKATHIELVSDLSTEGFIAALRRFVARRGRPLSLYCDNATNFTGAEKELKLLLNQFLDQQFREKVSAYCAESTIQFHFIPARAPTFGGLWEAAVRALKHHLRRVVGTEALTAEAMQTVLCQIESCLNSRPLTAVSENPNDVTAITPGHFLVGSALQSIPEPDLSGVPTNRLSLWQAIQRKTQQFWKLWTTDYLHQLQQRTKDLYRQPNLLVGKLVLLKEDNLPPLRWSMGRITAVRPGPDGLVRVVSVKIPSGAVYDRPVVKVCLLPINDLSTADNPEDEESATSEDEE
ncbi:uncharacterized protein LOC119766331 [Culex quinquefasciatus]|uniref:uncharacterized protein LOC119766331 n=1 Tax=Culex quinquefasciatus TaxID=7176 RepID=UPI0018E3D24A|nr:uncharacterized protein LOC119766331 [Culex quinquefasciatus]